MFDVPKKKYRHLKSGVVYEYVMKAKREEDGVDLVVYKSVQDGKIWTRPESEFFDGRFVECSKGMYSIEEGRLNTTLSVLVYRFLVALDRHHRMQERKTWTSGYVHPAHDREMAARSMSNIRQELEIELIRSQAE